MKWFEPKCPRNSKTKDVSIDVHISILLASQYYFS